MRISDWSSDVCSSDLYCDGAPIYIDCIRIKAEFLTDGQSLRCKGFIGFHQIEIIDGPACLLQSALRCWHRAYALNEGSEPRWGQLRHRTENGGFPPAAFFCRKKTRKGDVWGNGVE